MITTTLKIVTFAIPITQSDCRLEGIERRLRFRSKDRKINYIINTIKPDTRRESGCVKGIIL